MMKEGGVTGEARQELIIVLNWFEELKRLVPTEWSYCQKLWMEHQAAISSSRTPLMNFTFSMTSPRRR